MGGNTGMSTEAAKPQSESSNWVYRAALIAPASQQAQGNALAEQVTGRSGQEADTYSIPLSDVGSGGPVTHYGCCSCVTEAMLTAMQTILAAGTLPGVLFYRWDAEAHALLSTNSPTALASIGQAWGWAESVSDAGLIVVGSEGSIG